MTMAITVKINDGVVIASDSASTLTDSNGKVVNVYNIGGAIEIATITKHEGFKWIKRKHFFNENLNPIT